MIDIEEDNVIELVGGPRCGDMFKLDESSDLDVFDVPYEITSKGGKLHKFEAQYTKRMDGKAQYCGG
jgi:hypothetical protein